MLHNDDFFVSSFDRFIQGDEANLFCVLFYYILVITTIYFDVYRNNQK